MNSPHASQAILRFGISFLIEDATCKACTCVSTEWLGPSWTMGIYWKMEPVYVLRIPGYCTTLSLSLLAADKMRKNFIGFGGPMARPWKKHVPMTRKVRLRANEVATPFLMSAAAGKPHASFIVGKRSRNEIAHTMNWQASNPCKEISLTT